MRWERLAPLICITILLVLGFVYVIGDTTWQLGKKDYVFPGGRLRPPPWVARSLSTAPFNGYVSWTPDDRGKTLMSLGWHYSARPLAVEALRKQALTTRIEQALPSARKGGVSSLALAVTKERAIFVDGHNGTEFVLGDPKTGEVVGAAYCWHCPTSRRSFILKTLQMGAAGKKVLSLERTILAKVRCHEAGVDPEEFERKTYRLSNAGIYKLNPLRPCVHQYRHASGQVAFTIYWYPARLAELTAEAARDEGLSLAASFQLEPEPWKVKERSVSEHPAWEGTIRGVKKKVVLRFLLWNCKQTGKSYEMLSVISRRGEGGPFDPWQSARRIECH